MAKGAGAEILAAIKAEMVQLSVHDMAMVAALAEQIRQVVNSHPLGSWALALIGAEMQAEGEKFSDD